MSDTPTKPILPREKWFWAGLALLLLLACWLYLRGYNVSLPYIEHPDEAQNLLEAQHIIDEGHARGVYRESYPPGLRLITYPALKYLKPADAHHGVMLPPLRLIVIAGWLAAVAVIANLGALLAHPLTGLLAAALWIVCPWVVDRAHFVLPDGFNTLFSLLALWLALVSHSQRRRSFNTAAVYSIMLATAFKTQAIVVAPAVILLPLLNGWRIPSWRKEALEQVFWNCLRFAVFLYWLLLLYPTLDAPKDISFFPVTELRFVMPSPQTLWLGLTTLLSALLQPLWLWLIAALGGGLVWRYRHQFNVVALLLVSLSALAWLLGTHLLPTRGFSLRQYFGMGAMLAILFAVGLTAIMHCLDDLLRRLPPDAKSIVRWLPAGIVSLFLAFSLLPNYRISDALAHNYTRPDRRVDLMRYMDSSLEPGKYITDRDGPMHKVFNRAWGGYDGLHDFPVAQSINDLDSKPLEVWRENGAIYAIMPYPDDGQPADSYFPNETVLLKSYPPDPAFRGPSMVVLRLFPMQNRHNGQLGPIRLLGFDISARKAQAGGDIILRHYWQASSAPQSALHVFNHLLDSSGELVAQVDGIPLYDSRRDATSWDDPAETLLGRNFILRLPEDLPPGDYRLVSGFYDPATWRRLPSPDGGDSLPITDIRVVGERSEQ